MKIAFYTDTYLPNTDGVVSQIVATKKELERRGNSVHVFTSGAKEEKKAADRTVSVYPSVRFPPYPQYKLALFPYISAMEVDKLGLELVHCHALASMGLAAVYSAKILRLPLVGTFHTMAPLAMHYLAKNKAAQYVLSQAAWKAIEMFYTPFDAVTAPSHVIASLLKRHGIENVKVISNGIDLHKFNPQVKGRDAMRRRLGVKSGEKLITFVGRVTEEKNVDVLIKSAKLASSENPNFKLAIVGAGPALLQYKQLARELGLRNIVFTSGVGHSEISLYLAASDWQASASTFETQGLGIIEGLACGKPCIGANSLAIPEAVKRGKNGLLFEAGDVAGCTEQLLTALSISDKKYRQLSAYASRDSRKYSIEKTTSQLIKAYNSVL